MERGRWNEGRGTRGRDGTGRLYALWEAGVKVVLALGFGSCV